MKRSIILITILAGCAADSTGRSGETSSSSNGTEVFAGVMLDVPAPEEDVPDTFVDPPDPGPPPLDIDSVQDACKQDPADEANIQNAIDVGYGCFNGGCIGEDKTECLLQCLEPELSEPCAECLVAFMICTLKDCADACGDGAADKDCTKCLDTVCNPLFETCAGLYAPTR